MAERGQVVASEPALVVAVHNLLNEGRTMDALGAFYLTAACECRGHADGWSIVGVEPGLELHLCGKCGRPTNRDDLLPATPYGTGDVVFWCAMLWTIANEPGPTGACVIRPLDSDDTATVHVLQLNLED